MIKDCRSCRFHRLMLYTHKKTTCTCTHSNQSAWSIHTMRMVYSPHGLSYEHCGDIAARVGCKHFKINLRSYKEVKNLERKLAVGEPNVLWETKQKNHLERLFIFTNPYSEGFYDGFVKAIDWVLRKYDIKSMVELTKNEE